MRNDSDEDKIGRYICIYSKPAQIQIVDIKMKVYVDGNRVRWNKLSSKTTNTITEANISLT